MRSLIPFKPEAQIACRFKKTALALVCKSVQMCDHNLAGFWKSIPVSIEWVPFKAINDKIARNVEENAPSPKRSLPQRGPFPKEVPSPKRSLPQRGPFPKEVPSPKRSLPQRGPFPKGTTNPPPRRAFWVTLTGSSSISPHADGHHPNTAPVDPEKFQTSRQPSNAPVRGPEKRDCEDCAIAPVPL